MARLTDPARELFEIISRLTQDDTSPGAVFLAGEFDVNLWSTEFYKIVSCILERTDLVISIVQRSDMDADLKINAVDDLNQFKDVFGAECLAAPWTHRGRGLAILRERGWPIQYLSQTVRKKVSYPELSVQEIEETLQLVDTYLSELEKSQVEPEFVRQAIMDGMTTFRFQLKYVGWMGSGYALSAFREVLFAYQMAEQSIAASPDLDADVALRGMLDIIVWFKEKIDAVEGWQKTTKTVLTGWQLASTAATTLYLTGNLPALTYSAFEK